jgi:deoxyribonuclease V
VIAAVDVHYDDGARSARAACLVFDAWDAAVPVASYAVTVADVAPYEPGAFYRRELPCLLAVLDLVQESIEIVIVDGYVDLELGHPGLGRHLHAARGSVVVGVAKTHYRDAQAVSVVRGTSRSPLYVSAAGLSSYDAAAKIRGMHGAHRIPALLQQVDALSRMPTKGNTP